MSLQRKLKRQNAQKVKVANKPIANMSPDVMSMTLPRTLVINVDTSNVYSGALGTPIKDLDPVIEGEGLPDQQLADTLKEYILANEDKLDKVIMTMTEPESDEDDAPDFPDMPNMPDDGKKGKKMGFKVMTIKEVLDSLG